MGRRASLLKGLTYYPFNGDAKDESGNGNDGEVANAEFVSSGFGVDGKAGKFTMIIHQVKCGNRHRATHVALVVL